jgi:probable rRNA maturation factor
LNRRDLNICFVDDREIAKLNARYRGKGRPTDVLSFPWGSVSPSSNNGVGQAEWHIFLGDVVISVQTARRNARAEGHSTLNEIRWLILHGVLHLVGYDHETDHGEMTAREVALRERLGIAGRGSGRRARSRGRAHHG